MVSELMPDFGCIAVVDHIKEADKIVTFHDEKRLLIRVILLMD
jgi:hypothetical protein